MAMQIDEERVECTPCEEFGAIGRRGMCELRAGGPTITRRLLIRRKEWPQVAIGSTGPADLQTEGLLPSFPIALRKPSPGGHAVLPTEEKTYLEQVDGKWVPSSVYQQDVTDLRSLTAIVKAALKRKDISQAWQLLKLAQAALEAFCDEVAATNQSVPLQPPSGLAFAQRRIVLVDGPFVLLAATKTKLGKSGSLIFKDTPAGEVYAHWFGADGLTASAAPERAKWLHDQALARYAAELLCDSCPDLDLSLFADQPDWALVTAWFKAQLEPPPPSAPPAHTPGVDDAHT